MKRIGIILLVCCLTGKTFCQTETPTEVQSTDTNSTLSEASQVNDTGYVHPKITFMDQIATVGFGFGLNSFNGDIAGNRKSNLLNNTRSTIQITVEKRIIPLLSLGGTYLNGKFSENNNSALKNNNFESSVQEFGGYLSLNFDQRFKCVFAPYISAGVNIIQYNSATDLRDENGQAYHFWSDGKIRNAPQFDESGKSIEYEELPGEIYRDYSYETDIKSGSAIAFPVTVGVKFKTLNNFEGRIFGTYSYINSDEIDGKLLGSNDQYIFAGVSIHYTIGKKYIAPGEEDFVDVDFTDLKKQDTDKDGVNDFEDQCADTKVGIPVDPTTGCPSDSDKDGVYDYLDKEPNSKKGAEVDQHGVTLTEEDIEIRDRKRKGNYFELIEKETDSEEDD